MSCSGPASKSPRRGGPAPRAVYPAGAPGGRPQQMPWRLSPAPRAVYLAGAPWGWDLRSSPRLSQQLQLAHVLAGAPLPA
eukprot:7180539-Pyramimonas_sp.AAC.1